MHSRDADLVKHYNDNFDDSSDEEDINKTVNRYDINESWNRFKKEKKITQDVSDNLLSFVAHAAGIQLLYSDKINLLYYPLKQKYLHYPNNDTPSSLLEGNIKQAIFDSFNDTLESIREYVSQTNQKLLTEKQITELYKKNILNMSGDIKKVAENMVPNCVKWIKDNRYRGYILEPDQFLLEYETLIIVFSDTYIDLLGLKTGTDDREQIKNKLLENSKNEFLMISKKYSFSEKENAEGKKEALELIAGYKGPFQKLKNKIIELLNSSNARGYVENMILKKLEEDNHSQQLMIAYINDIQASLKNKKSKVSKDHAELVKKYYSFDKESIKELILTELKINIRIQLKNILKNITRPLLRKLFSFESQNPYSFYANIRLSNRSQKRHISNLKFLPFRNESVSRIWSFFKNDQVDSSVLEIQEITSLSLARKDMVLDAGNYEKIFLTLSQLKNLLLSKDISVDDKKIVEWIRAVFNGQMIEISHESALDANITAKIQTLTYLLFGCEAIRNPAMIVVNQMLLDLISKTHTWSFEEAFTRVRKGNNMKDEAKIMPMIPEGAVSVARGLESDLRQYMPYPYIYNGTEENHEGRDKFNKSDLVQAEALIVKSWLKLMNFPLTSVKPQTPQKLLDLIFQTEMNWFSTKGISYASEGSHPTAYK